MADEQLVRYAEQYWDTVPAFAPTTATMLGDHRFDDRIEDVTADAEQRTVATFRRLQRMVESIELGGLDSSDRLLRTLLLDDLDRAATELEWRPVEMGAGQMDGVHARLLTTLSQTTAP